MKRKIMCITMMMLLSQLKGVLKITEVATLEGQGDGDYDDVTSAAFSCRKKLLAFGYRWGTIELWNFDGDLKFLRAWKGHKKDVKALCFSHDGDLLASASDDGIVRTWGVSSILQDFDGESLKPMKTKCLLSRQKMPIFFSWFKTWIYSVAFSPHGTFIACALCKKIKVLGSQNAMKKFKTLDGAYVVVFSPDGKYLLTSSNDNKIIKLWDVKNWKLLKMFRAHDDDVDAVAFSPDGRLFVTASWDGTIALWDIQDVLKTPDSEEPKSIRILDVSEDCVKSVFFVTRKLVAAVFGDRAIKLWKLEDGKDDEGLEGDGIDGDTERVFCDKFRELAI